jgi:hypothetical protein
MLLLQCVHTNAFRAMRTQPLATTFEAALGSVLIFSKQ